MREALMWIVGLVISVIVVGIIGFMMALFSPQIAKETTDENLFV